MPDVAKPLGVSAQSLYKWLKEYLPNPIQRYEAELKEVRRENLRLKAELQRTKEDRVKYAFILGHRKQFKVQRMCRLFGVSQSGYYDWSIRPVFARDKDNTRLLKLIRDSYEASGRTYGAPRVFFDLLEVG